MKPMQHETTNQFLLAPPGDAECIDLPITRVIDAQGQHTVVSFWRPSDAEREAIARGAPIQLTCFAETHAPIWVGVDGVGE